MKILSPINSPREVESLAQAGASEFYCGVLPESWRKNFTNVASPNRREWSVSSLTSHEQLLDATDEAHRLGCSLFLTLNAFYTAGQYESLGNELKALEKIPVDGVIVADPGVMSLLRKGGWDREIHVSTGAVALNGATIRLYRRKFGVARIVLPRHMTIHEMETIASQVESLQLECFIMNSGCKNIDGFCTYHHGVNEILHRGGYTLPKKIGLDYHLYRFLRCLPGDLPGILLRPLSGRSDSACLLDWHVEPRRRLSGENITGEMLEFARRQVADSFGLWSGLDPCGACAIPRLSRAGIGSIKIVGRENPTFKKLLDVKFLRKMLDMWESGDVTLEDYPRLARQEYEKTYGAPCREWCYYTSSS